MTDPRQLHLGFYRLDDLRRLLADPAPLRIGPDAAEAIARGAAFVAAKVEEDRYIYGVNTGFGSLCETRVAQDEVRQLQYRQLLSHAAGVGEPVPEEIARLTLFIKLLTFRGGHTGIALPTVQRLVDFWNAGCIPAIPKRGTVGASGDLAPLAHMGLPLIGMGDFLVDGGIERAPVVLERMGWEPLVLGPKEGLAITNGVQYIDALAAHCLLRITDLVRAAEVMAALSLQAFSCSRTFYDPLYVRTSLHRERMEVAANLRRLLEGSNHHELPTCNRSMQDPYSFRCIPQVHGAVRQLVGFAATTLENEINGVSDNPLFFPDEDRILLGGNLHGQSTAFLLDVLAMAVAELSSVSERRAYQLLSGRRGLPDFLVRNAGLNSGLMIVQYTAAAMVNENKVLATPASVDTIPTCQLQEDSVSMGGTSGYKLLQAVDNLEYVLGIELLTAAQAVDLLDGLRLSPATARVHARFREEVPTLEEDRIVAADIETARDVVRREAGRWRRELELA